MSRLPFAGLPLQCRSLYASAHSEYTSMLPIPSDATPHTNAGSPTDSAAAMKSRHRVCSGRTSIRRRKFASTPPDNRTALASPNPPPSSCGFNPLGDSSNANGLPLRLRKDLITDPSVQRPDQGSIERRPAP